MTLNSSISSLSETIVLNFVKVIPFRKGKERIVDFIRQLIIFPEGTIRQCLIDNDVPIFVDLFERIQSYMYFVGEFERYETRKFISSIHPGYVVIDLGANIGYFSLIALKRVGLDGHVFSFEASPRVYESLYKNCSLSKNKNISAFKLAVADKEGILTFNLPRNPQEQGSGSLAEGIGDIEVEAITIDKFVQRENLTRLDFIKMDIEGAEIKAFFGMKSTILTYKPKLIFEFSPGRYQNSDLSEFHSFAHKMKGFGYRFLILTRTGKWKSIESFPMAGVSTIYAEIFAES
jgi:FkbM family methyltransferase